MAKKENDKQTGKKPESVRAYNKRRQAERDAMSDEEKTRRRERMMGTHFTPWLDTSDPDEMAETLYKELGPEVTVKLAKAILAKIAELKK